MDEDLDVVERFKAGEKEAFSILINKYKKPVLNLVYRFTGERRDAEDLAQEIFLRAYRGLDRFQAKAKFFTWLYRIAMNLCFRVRKRRSKFIFQSLDQKSENGNYEAERKMTSLSNPVEDEIGRGEIREKVQQAVMDLSPEQRAVVILYRYNDLSYDEIAGVLDISISAVKSRLHRARQTLKEALKQYVSK
ncbi:MAG: sigma-70 family RNA polymerase sigma factor [Candidatus Eremiobacteraeota bacterium]|nr:sigma-70 family RNA polymerase sigma factor [Candidatus Eremiobacteraeota bacterium]